MAEKKRYKKYVEVTVNFDESGKMLPRTIKWDDELTYEIDKVTDIKQAASMRCGGQGDRYTIKVNGKETYGDAKNTEATAEMITMCSTIAMKIMVYALSMLPREERGSHLDKMKDMTMMYTELFIHRLLSADTGEEE